MVTEDDLKHWRSAAAFTLGIVEGERSDVGKVAARMMRTTWNELTEKIGDGKFAPTEEEAVEFDKVMGLVMS